MRLPRSIQWRIALAYTFLILASMLALSLYLAIDTKRADAPATRTIAAASGIAAALSVLVALLIAWRTTRSIRALAREAKRIAEGDLETSIPGGLTEEAQELAKALQTMALRLKAMATEYSGEHSRLSAILSTMTDGVVLIGAEGRIVLANPAASELLGFPSFRPGEHRFVELVRDHELHHLLTQCQRTGQLQHGELELRPSRRYLSAIATPLAPGSDEGVLLTLHDLTQARRVDTTRREFVANVSHELRTPLASVKAAIETLEGGALEEPEMAHQFLHRITRDLDRMTRIVEGLLKLSRLETGETGLHVESFDIYKPVSEAVEVHGPRAQEKGLDLTVTAVAGLPPALGDEPMLQQVMSNLLDNAIKFTPTGGQIVITPRARGDYLEVSVKDTGIGIGTEHIPHIFERFYMVDRSAGDRGTGLGLAIAKHIVLAHGGEIWVDSAEGEGSTFTFTVPAERPK